MSDSSAPKLSLSKKLVFSFVAITAVFALSITILETAGRIYMHYRHGVPGTSYGIYSADDELGAVHRPHSYNSNSVINNWGFRNVGDINEKPARGAHRIYCSGGSTTFCYNLRTEEAWPSLLQERLRVRPGHQADEVLNAGEICFSVAHEYRLARRLIPILRPDVVIIYTGINEELNANDLKNAEGADFDRLLAERQWNVAARTLDQARFLKRNSILVRYFDYVLKSKFEKLATARFHPGREVVAGVMAAVSRPLSPQQPSHPWVVFNFEQTLRAYLQFLKQQGCKVIIVRWGDAPVARGEVQEWYRERAVAIGKEYDATICDITSAVESRPDVNKLFIDTGVHVTRAGADVTSNALLATLQRVFQQ